MSKLLKLLGGSAAPLLDKAAEVADRFIDTPAEKKAFIKEAYQQEVLDRKEARELGKNKVTPDVLNLCNISYCYWLSGGYIYRHT